MAHGVTDDLPVPEVLDPGQIKPALVSRNISDIGHPRLVGDGDGKFLIQQVRSNGQIVVRIGRRLVLLDLLAAYLHLTTQALDPIDADLHLLHLGQLVLNLIWPVSAAPSLVGRIDRNLDPLFLQFTC